MLLHDMPLMAYGSGPAGEEIHDDGLGPQAAVWRQMGNHLETAHWLARSALAGWDEVDDAERLTTIESLRRGLREAQGRLDLAETELRSRAQQIVASAPETGGDGVPAAPVARDFDSLVAALARGGYAPVGLPGERGVRSCCPGHDDDPNAPSLWLRERADGIVLAKCWTEDCPPERIFERLNAGPMIERIETPDSRWIRAVAINRSEGRVEVETAGRVYGVASASIPAETTWRMLLAAESKGVFFNERIKGNPDFSVVALAPEATVVTRLQHHAAHGKDRTQLDTRLTKEWMPVDSSWVRSLGYDHATKRLEIETDRGFYAYEKIDSANWNALKAADSKGGYINSVIKPGTLTIPVQTVDAIRTWVEHKAARTLDRTLGPQP